MQDFDRAIRSTLSDARFESYRREPTDAADDILARYTWNMALSEALYPILQAIEIALRNRINEAAAAEFDDPWWFDRAPPLDHRELAFVTAAKAELTKRGKPVEVGRLVAELNFGFWTSLLDVRYERVLWPRLLRLAFPWMPRRQRTRHDLSRRFTTIRRLRNRVFHHEPIWHWHDLPRQHAALVEALGWMSTELRDLIVSFDRFPSVYNAGVTDYRHQIHAFLTERQKL